MSNRQKLKLSDILRGKFLVEKNAFSNWQFIVFIVVLGFIMITASNSMNNKSKEVQELKVKVEEYKSQYAELHSKLMKLKVESELVPQMAKDSLFPLEEHPIKIVIKPQ